MRAVTLEGLRGSESPNALRKLAQWLNAGYRPCKRCGSMVLDEHDSLACVLCPDGRRHEAFTGTVTGPCGNITVPVAGTYDDGTPYGYDTTGGLVTEDYCYCR